MRFDLNAWLRRQPQPVAVIVRDADAKEQRVEVGKDGRAWKNLVRTLEGMLPYARLTLLNGQGAVIRAKSFDEEISEDEPAATKGEDTEIVVFARLLTEATKDQPILKHAMEFIAQQSASITRYMAECEKLRADNNRLRLQIGQLQMTPTDEASADNSVMAVLTTLAQGAQAGKIMKQQGGLKQVPGPKEVAK